MAQDIEKICGNCDYHRPPQFWYHNKRYAICQIKTMVKVICETDNADNCYNFIPKVYDELKYR